MDGAFQGRWQQVTGAKPCSHPTAGPDVSTGPRLSGAGSPGYAAVMGCAAVLGTGFEYRVEGRLGGAAEPREPRLLGHLAKPLLTGLRTESGGHLL